METKPKTAYPARRHPRYTVRDVRLGQDTHLTGKVREPWQVIDTLRNKIFDAFHSKRAAVSTAREMNRNPEGETE